MLVGHVTKDGSIAGPRLLEHLVDVVCQFDGERHSRLRLLRAVKNRYGPTDEVGCFDLTEAGIEGLADPSGLFVSRTKEPVSGTCITVTLEGRRPLVAEVQALLAETVQCAAAPRHQRAGFFPRGDDDGRAAAPRTMSLHKDDSYVATVGGVRLSEPATDLATALAIGLREDQPAAAAAVDRLRRGGAGRRGAPGARNRPAHPGGRTARVHARDGSGFPGRSGPGSGRIHG